MNVVIGRKIISNIACFLESNHLFQGHWPNLPITNLKSACTATPCAENVQMGLADLLIFSAA